MEYKYLLLNLLWLYCLPVAGQENLLKGNVIDEGNKLIDIFNVIILNPIDSSYIKGETFFEGHFEMKYDQSGNSLLQITSLGYEDVFLPIYVDKRLDLKAIVMKTKVEQIKEIIVSGSRPIVRQVHGKTVVLVSNTPLVHLGSVENILKRAPGLKLEDGSLIVFGRGEPLIFIDGKQVQAFSEVEILQPNEIISIEIDRNPSAKYLATARAVLNIKTKRGNLEGLSTQVFNTSAFARKYSNETGIRFNLSKGKFDNFLGYDYSKSKSKDYVEAFEYNYQDDYVLKSVTDEETHYTDDTHKLLWGSTCHITAKTDFSLQYNMIQRDIGNRIKREQVISGKDADNQTIDISENDDFSRPTHILNATCNFKPDSVSGLIFSADYVHHGYSDFQAIAENTVSTGDNVFKDLKNDNSSNVYVFRSEYSTSALGNCDLLLGFRYGHIGTNSTTGFVNHAEETANYEDLTEIRENNYAAYFTYGHSFGHIGFDAGLRYEGVKYKALANGETIRDKMDNHLFPSINIFSIALVDHLELSLGYTSKISRPAINELDPSVQYLSRISSTKGNPLLKPTLFHNIGLNIELWEALSLSIEYTYEKYPRILAGTSSTDNPGIIIFTPVNINKLSMWVANVSYNNKWGPYELNTSFGVEFPDVTIPFLGQILHRTHPSYDFSIGNNLTLSKSTYASCSFNYWSKSIDLMTDYYPTYDLSLSLSQYLWEKRLQITLEANDLFRKYFGDWRDKYGTIECGEYLSNDSRNVKLTVRYNFNNYKNVYKRKSNSEEEINRIIN